MAAPGLTFTVSGTRLSDETGFDFITVSFTSDIAYTAFECRATKEGEDYGVGRGVLVRPRSMLPIPGLSLILTVTGPRPRRAPAGRGRLSSELAPFLCFTPYCLMRRA